MTPDLAGRPPSRLRLLGWSAAGVLLLLPLVAMQFTDQVNWSLFDFVLAAALLGGAGLTLELAVRTSRERTFRAGVGVAVAAAFLLVWSSGAVGIIGSEDHPANLLYFVVLAAALVGSLAARFRPRGMARALYGSAVLQLAIGALALILGWGAGAANWPWDVVGASLFFGFLWLAAGLLFRMTALDRAGTGSTP